MSRPLFAAALTAVLALPLAAHAAPIVVSSYAMQDGADLHGAYYDNLYTGTRSPSGYLSGGKGDLTDGVTAISVAAGYGAWAPYVMWDVFAPVITFDLGSVYTLGSVMTYFKYYPQAAVYMPASVSLRFSDDGITYGATQLRTLTVAERVPGSNDSDGIFDVLTSADSGRYVEMSLNQQVVDPRWLALAEVTFDGTPGGLQHDTPEPGSLALALGALAGLIGTGARRRQRAA